MNIELGFDSGDHSFHAFHTYAYNPDEPVSPYHPVTTLWRLFHPLSPYFVLRTCAPDIRPYPITCALATDPPPTIRAQKHV